MLQSCWWLYAPYLSIEWIYFPKTHSNLCEVLKELSYHSGLPWRRIYQWRYANDLTLNVERTSQRTIFCTPFCETIANISGINIRRTVWPFARAQAILIEIKLEIFYWFWMSFQFHDLMDLCICCFYLYIFSECLESDLAILNCLILILILNMRYFCNCWTTADINLIK